MRPIDVVVVLAYFALVLAVGVAFRGRQRDAADYFLGQRGLPWWAIMFSIVGTETSALTIISVPGIAARGDLTFLQLPFGYLVGRIGVAAFLLRGYFDGTQETAYERLERRFGPAARRAAGGIFLLTRAMGEGVRLFATALPLAIITGWDMKAGILAVAVVTIFYAWIGGLRSIVWVDVLQLTVYLIGGVATLIVATNMAGGWSAFERAWEAGKLTVVNPSFSLKITYTLWSGLIGGALLSAASHGTDQLLVQRLLASRGLRDAKRALIGSGVFVIAQFALFVLVGTSLWLAGADRPDLRSDAIYPTFAIEHLPPGLAGLVVAAILAAASVAAALNSLASSSTYDFYAPLTGRRDEQHLLKVGRVLTLVWAAILVIGAMLVTDRDTPVVELALGITSITYGGLLGSYLLGGLWPRARQVDVIIAIVVSVLIMVPIAFAGTLLKLIPDPDPHALITISKLAWPWFVPLGTAITVLVGMVASFVGRSHGHAAGQAQPA
jgi:SSS family solute:Na+ symporter